LVTKDYTQASEKATFQNVVSYNGAVTRIRPGNERRVTSERKCSLSKVSFGSRKGVILRTKGAD